MGKNGSKRSSQQMNFDNDQDVAHYQESKPSQLNEISTEKTASLSQMYKNRDAKKS
jgi:hypothetical protein